MSLVVGLFGSHDPGYPRTRSIVDGLRLVGVSVVDLGCARAAPAPWRLAAQAIIGLRASVDVYWVTYPGYVSIFAAWLVGRVRKRPVIFDAFVSLVETRFDERRDRPAWQRPLAQLAERLALRIPDIVVFDTEQHRRWFMDRHRLAADKCVVVPVTTNATPAVASPLARAESRPFTVLWYGKFAPLHGIETIVDAARVLWERGDGSGIRFVLVGDVSRAESWRPGGLGPLPPNVELRHPVPFEQLPFLLAEADAVLGIFGTTAKADRVVPNKVVEAIAAGRPLVTASTSAVRDVLCDRQDVLLVAPGDVGGLVAALCELRQDGALRDRLVRGARDAYENRFSPRVASHALCSALSAASGEGRALRVRCEGRIR